MLHYLGVEAKRSFVTQSRNPPHQTTHCTCGRRMWSVLLPPQISCGWQRGVIVSWPSFRAI